MGKKKKTEFIGMGKLVAIEDCLSCGGNESLLFFIDYGGPFGICDHCGLIVETEYQIKTKKPEVPKKKKRKDRDVTNT